MGNFYRHLATFIGHTGLSAPLPTLLYSNSFTLHSSQRHLHRAKSNVQFNKYLAHLPYLTTPNIINVISTFTYYPNNDFECFKEYRECVNSFCSGDAGLNSKVVKAVASDAPIIGATQVSIPSDSKKLFLFEEEKR